MGIINHPSNYYKVCMILINLVRVLYQITFDIFIVLPFVCNYIYINRIWVKMKGVRQAEHIRVTGGSRKQRKLTTTMEP